MRPRWPQGDRDVERADAGSPYVHNDESLDALLKGDRFEFGDRVTGPAAGCAEGPAARPHAPGAGPPRTRAREPAPLTW